MTVQSGNEVQDRIVVGYFSDGADALRAINELIDEGFRASEIGAAFRTPRAGGGIPAGGNAAEMVTDTAGSKSGRSDDLTPAGDRNPAATGSVGGAGSHDEAVQPAGLAPGSGNAFPAPSRPGPIPGGELPSTLKHDLPSTLPSDLAGSGRESVVERMPPVARDSAQTGSGWGSRLKHVWGGQSRPESGPASRQAGSSSMKFGTGEGHLDLSSAYDYSDSSFESSFVGMGLGSEEARSLTGELGRGGAVVSVTPGTRAALAEGIIERNHGRLRFETTSAAGEPMSEDRRVEIFGRMQNYYRPEDDLRSRRAS
jgi:hypothetical protein